MRMAFLAAAILFFATLPLASLFASNSSFGGTIYVLAEHGNSTLGEGTVYAFSPSGKISIHELSRGQAKINASEPGKWEFRWGNESASASVFEGVPAGDEEKKTEPPFLAATALLSALAIAVLALYLNCLRASEPSFSKTESGKTATAVFTCGNEKLGELRIFTCEKGRLVLKKQDVNARGKISVSWGLNESERGKPALAILKCGGEEARIFSSGEQEKGTKLAQHPAKRKLGKIRA